MAKYKYIFIALLIILCISIIPFIYTGSKGNDDMDSGNKDEDNNQVEKTFEVTSQAFGNGATIPNKYTAYGENVSIPLEFHNVPGSGKSIAIIMDDPDAPSTNPFVHWLIWNIKATTKEITEAIPSTKEVSSLGGAIQGRNNFGTIGYKGPQPPSGTHTYKIKVYVLDDFLDLGTSNSKSALENAMDGHILKSYLLEGKVSHQ